MPEYAVRVDLHSQYDVHRLIEWCANVFTCYYCVREQSGQQQPSPAQAATSGDQPGRGDGGQEPALATSSELGGDSGEEQAWDRTTNPHAHLYGVAELSFRGLVSSFRRFFPDHVGNGAYSIKPCTSSVYDYWKYISKGASRDDLPDVIVRQGLRWTDEYIVELHAAYWMSNDELVRTGKKRDSLKLSGTVVEQVERLAKEAKVEGYDREAIARIYVKMYVEARKPVSIYHAKSVVNTVCAALSESSFDLLVSDIASRM